jgi:chitodextrinase
MDVTRRFIRRGRVLPTAAFISVVLALSLVPSGPAHAATPSFVQGATNSVTSGKTVSKTFSTANTAGNLIVAYLMWSNTGSASVTDSKGDVYTAATARTTWGSQWSSQVFYAANIAGGTNTVTASFGTSITSFGLLYTHEYSGLATSNPLDVTASATGSAKAMNSGSATTTNANDLIFAGGGSNSSVTAAGTGFTLRSTAYGNVAEDKKVTTAGSYNATATQNSNQWVLQMVAFKAASAVVDTTAPTVPTNLTATATGTSSVNLAWTASTDNVGVTGYKVLRNGTQVATSSGTSYQDTGLASGTTYAYSVEAFDAAGNTSAASTAVSATTTTPDTTPPTAPADLAATATSPTQVTLSWTPSTDNVGVTGYQVFRNGTQVGTTTGATTYSDSGLTPATTYSYTVAAVDAAGNASAQSAAATATTFVQPPDTTPPTVPTGLVVATTPTSATLSWTASTDDVGVVGYHVFRNGVEVGTATTPSFQDTGLTASTTYSYTVSAFDAAGNESVQSSAVNAVTQSAASPISGKLVTTGDSYTSGYGSPPYKAGSGGCFVSQGTAYINYAATQLAALGGSITQQNNGCSGATTASTISGGLSNLSGAQWIAMTVGANDYDFVDDLAEGTSGLQSLTSHQANITANVVKVVTAAKKTASNAKYFILGYPDLMPPTGTNISTCFGSDAGDFDLASDHQMYTVIDTALQNAASQSGATFVETSNEFVGHDMCAGANSWFTPYGETDTWHPIAAGYQELGTLLAQAIRVTN